LKLHKISEWEWRQGTVRAASHKDPRNSDLSVSIFLLVDSIVCLDCSSKSL